MKGFFKKSEVEGVAISRKSTIPQCGICKLNKQCTNPKLPVEGKGGKRILIVGDAPSERSHLGPTGRFMEEKLDDLGLDLEEDCWYTNSVICKPKDGTPTGLHVNSCRPSTMKTLKELQPTLIITLGSNALLSVIGDQWSGSIEGVGRWRGWQIPDRVHKAWICPMFHPSFFHKKDDKKEKGQDKAEQMFVRDLEEAISLVGKPFPDMIDEETLIQCETDMDVVNQYLIDLILNPKTISFDFETTGIKPQANGHRIATCAISDGKTAISFPVKKQIKKNLKKVLEDPRIKKIGANIKFETVWAFVRLGGCRVQGWVWDTMLATHILDQRTGIVRLDFQVYVNFGIPDYSSSIKQYLQSNDDQGANTLNTIFKAPIMKLLMYGGLDALFEFWLAKIQKRKMKDA